MVAPRTPPFEAERFGFSLCFMIEKDKKKMFFFFFKKRIQIRERTRFEENSNCSLATAPESLLVFLNEYGRICKCTELPL
jgi:hypothetical protein